MIKITLLCLLILTSCSENPVVKLNRHESSQLPKTKLYEDTEVIFKDEYTPGSCRSPFR